MILSVVILPPIILPMFPPNLKAAVCAAPADKGGRAAPVEGRSPLGAGALACEGGSREDVAGKPEMLPS